MRVLGIVLSVLGPLATFFIGAIATALVILGSPFTINTPAGYVATGIAVVPGVAMSAVAVVLGLRAAGQQKGRAWLITQGVWLTGVVVATLVVAVWFNSNDLPWFFPLIALPLVSLIYWIANR